jgi:hypothetical protein
MIHRFFLFLSPPFPVLIPSQKKTGNISVAGFTICSLTPLVTT